MRSRKRLDILKCKSAFLCWSLLVLFSIVFDANSSFGQCEITIEKIKNGKQKTYSCDRLLDVVVNNRAIQVFDVAWQDSSLVIGSQYALNDSTSRDTTVVFHRTLGLEKIEGLVLCSHRKIEKCGAVRQNQKFGVWLERVSNAVVLAGFAGFVLTGNYYFAAGAGVGILFSAFSNRILKVKYFDLRKRWRISETKTLEPSNSN